MQERMHELHKKILVYKWDEEHGQLNPAKKAKLTKLKEEYEKLKEQLKF